MNFPISDASPARLPGPQPSVCDVVVIGGGVTGVMTAWFLAERGLRVTVCEKGRIAAEPSSCNWGWVRQQGRDPAELPIMVKALRHWDGLALGFGDALGFRRAGVMYLAKTDREIAGFEGWLPHAQAHGVDTRLMSRSEVMATLNGAATGWKGGLITPSDARTEPVVAVPVIAAEAARCGVALGKGCAVRALDLAAGRVAGVVTEHGCIACDQVVLAGGAWSALFARAHGVSVPQLSVLASVAATDPMPEIWPGAAADDEFAFRRRADGGYSLASGNGHDFCTGPDALRNFGAYLPVLKKDLRFTGFRRSAPAGYPDGWTTKRRRSAGSVSPFERRRILNPAPNMVRPGHVQQTFARAFPGLGPPRLRAAWVGMIDTPPDMVRVTDRVAAIPGLVLATGMSGHGFGIGPGMGRVIADLVAGRAVGHDLSRFRLARFTDGSALTQGPSL